MNDYDGIAPGQVLADASVAEFIKTLGISIAEAQKALDENSVDQIAEFIEPREGLGGKSLLDMGLSPAFYHYQHADITCSMQLSLKVEKDFSLGLNLSGSLKDTTAESSSSSETETSTESSSSTRKETREAIVGIASASTGSLTVGGRQFPLSGSDPVERIRNLRSALSDDPSTGIARVLYRLQRTDLTITTDADAEEVYTTSNSVAFLGGGFHFGIIRISKNVDTNYVINDSITANTTAQDTLDNYANHVKDQIEQAGYRTLLAVPGVKLRVTFKSFEIGEKLINPDWERELNEQAFVINMLGNRATVEGFADTQPYPGGPMKSDKENLRLGQDRAIKVHRALIDRGVPSNLLADPTSRGIADALVASNGQRGVDDSDFRKVDVIVKNGDHYYLFVLTRDGGPNIENIDPNMIGDTGLENGFTMLYRPSVLNLSGKKVTIEGIDFPLRGTAVAPHAEHAPEAYALNLSSDINSNTTAGLAASASSNIVTITKGSDQFELNLITAEQRQISLSGSSGVTVTEQFTRSRTSNLTQQNTGNRAVAVGASLDVRYSRQFEMNVTGNSSISARLVSIPAPPQFLETIKDFLDEE